jgi:hypothetical protein
MEIFYPLTLIKIVIQIIMSKIKKRYKVMIIPLSHIILKTTIVSIQGFLMTAYLHLITIIVQLKNYKIIIIIMNELKILYLQKLLTNKEKFDQK